MSKRRAFHPLDPRGASQRLISAVVLGALAWLATPSQLSTATRVLVAWVAGGVLLLVLAFVIIARADAEETRRRAAAHDPGRTTVWIIVLVTSGFSLLAATVAVHHVKELPGIEGPLLLGLSIAAVVVSWLLTHTAFTLRYAHLFYRGGPDGEGGLQFPGGDEPDDLDFAYYAFTVGMCFQVSDVAVTSRDVRRTTLAHAVLSFLYNTGILALAVNVVVNQLGA